MRMLSELLSICLSLCGVAASAGESVPAYSLSRTEVRDIHSTLLKRDYQVFVSLPAGYESSTRRYPVVFVTDANYGFPLVRAMVARLHHESRNLSDLIVVGLSYAAGNTPEQSRNRDYTPTASGYETEPGETVWPHGGAEAYRQHIKQEIFPVISKYYRADMNSKTLIGHSFGGLFGAYVLVSDPEMFQQYLLSSPSLWYDKEWIFKRLHSMLDARHDLSARIYLGIGSFERPNPNPHKPDPRFNRDTDMVDEVKRFARTLRKARFPNLQILDEVIAGEDHLTVNPITYTHGLMWLLPGSKDRSSGTH
ncbi:alpha/beta hydrolase [Burkholderiaceae bacterium DAT-1]|nr:alpha/beta hydrolase [Burkholderiaceae bacterium DAT-1]